LLPGDQQVHQDAPPLWYKGGLKVETVGLLRPRRGPNGLTHSEFVKRADELAREAGLSGAEEALRLLDSVQLFVKACLKWPRDLRASRRFAAARPEGSRATSCAARAPPKSTSLGAVSGGGASRGPRSGGPKAAERHPNSGGRDRPLQRGETDPVSPRFQTVLRRRVGGPLGRGHARRDPARRHEARFRGIRAVFYEELYSGDLRGTLLEDALRALRTLVDGTEEPPA